MSLWRLPEILTIQLKRFSFRNLLWRDKIDQKVHFPVEYALLFTFRACRGELIINANHVNVCLFFPHPSWWHVTDSWIYRLTCRASQNTEPPTISMPSSITTAVSFTVITHALLVVRHRRQTIAKRMSSVNFSILDRAANSSHFFIFKFIFYFFDRQVGVAWMIVMFAILARTV